MSFSLGSSRNPAIIVARTPVSRAQFKTVGQLRADEAAARSGRRQASYAANRLVAVPRGVPMYAVGHGQMGRGEVKFFDVNVTGPVTTSPYGLAQVGNVTGAEPATAFIGITELNCVQQGATAFNRIGTKIMIKSVKVDVDLLLKGSAPSTDTARLMVVYDRQPNGAFPAIASILSMNISSAPVFNSGINMANRSRFTILRNQLVNLSSDGDQGYHWSAFIKTKLETQFSSNAGNIGDVQTGAIYFIAFAYSSGPTGYIDLLTATSRIRYFD